MHDKLRKCKQDFRGTEGKWTEIQESFTITEEVEDVRSWRCIKKVFKTLEDKTCCENVIWSIRRHFGIRWEIVASV